MSGLSVLLLSVLSYLSVLACQSRVSCLSVLTAMPTMTRQACSPLIQLFFGFASDIHQTNINRDIRDGNWLSNHDDHDNHD